MILSYKGRHFGEARKPINETICTLSVLNIFPCSDAIVYRFTVDTDENLAYVMSPTKFIYIEQLCQF